MATARTKIARPLTRREAKALTRQRLLAAAGRLILGRGEAGVTASAVAREAGVAGATFYEHFRNRDELMKALAKDLFEELRRELTKRREEALQSPNDEDRLRQEFRTPIGILAANPELFRLALSVRHHAGSPLGDSSRRVTGNMRGDIAGELAARGYPTATAGERRRLEMIADIHIAATEVLALGYLAGRYPDLDEVLDMLVLVTRGTRLARGWTD
jgi:TetR/AcrR family transcriptional regulator, fatty acid biosynthesis regulator